jgi:hypothetical protein
MDKGGPRIPGRRLLRRLEGVEMWHIEGSEKRGQGIRYLVKHSDSEHTFERPHEAWRHFQQLTGAPERDVRPDPPPIDPTSLDLSRKPNIRRRRRDPTKPA